MKKLKLRLNRREPPYKWNNKFHILKELKVRVIGPGGLVRSVFRVASAKQLCLIIITVLAGTYVIAAVYNKSGDFNISIDRPMQDAGFTLSNTRDATDNLVTLRGDAVNDVTNINICDIASDVNMIDGSHNGKNYAAYTFYLKNNSDDDSKYEYEVRIRHATKGTENALWVMMFDNDVMSLYAKANKNGTPECQYSSHEFPFLDNSFDKEYLQSTITNENRGNITQEIIDYHRFHDLDGVYQLKTIPFVNDQMVCRKTGIEIASKEVHKYTIVAWLEGEDPECVNDILGGTIDLTVQFYYIK